MGRKKYCEDCGNRLNWWTEQCCDSCSKKLCSKCSQSVKASGSKTSHDYCTSCAVDFLKKQKEKIEQDKRVICDKCGNDSPRIDCVYCSFCGNLIRKDKIMKLNDKNKEEKEND